MTLAISASRKDDAEAAGHAAERVVEFGRVHGAAHYLASATCQAAWARARLGDGEPAAIDLENTIAVLLEQGNKVWLPLFKGLLADAQAERQYSAKALTRVAEALELANETGEHWTDSFLHRIRGEILLRRDPANTAPAEEAFLTAMRIAQQQKAKSFELRAVMSIARLWRDQGKREEARDLLAPVYGWFTEGFETLDLKEAKALLDELAA
jgi:predicted ATPase